MLLFLLRVTPVAAHKLSVFAWVNQQTLSVEATLSGGRHLVNGKVTIKDSGQDTVLQTGTTNRDGQFIFPLPETLINHPVDLNIIVSTDDGHRGQWLLTQDEYTTEQPSPAPVVSLKNSQTPSPPGYVTITLSREELSTMINTLLEKRLAPIQRQLALANEKKPSLSEIIGGIGYLIGLAGFATWLKNRNTN